MKRKIIKIDEEKCNGCGLCAKACHEGAIDIIDGVAKLMREDFCDGLGDCLPECPTGAITFEEREAPAYDELAVARAKEAKARMASPFGGSPFGGSPFGGCPGSRVQEIHHDPAPEAQTAAAPVQSQLTNWPVQIKLAPVQAPYFDGAKLLIAADCTAFAYANLHEDFIKGRVALIGCPKLDAVNYGEKLAQIIAENDIQDVTIVRMEVPCCGGLAMAAKQALQASGKFIPWQVVTIGVDGRRLD